MQRFIITASLSLALFSCTSTTVQNEIKTGNWFAVGEYDAGNGFIEKSEKNLQKMSARFSEKKVNYGAYLAGYEQALLFYCEPKNAYILGAKGLTYRNICDRYPRGWAFYQDWISGRQSRAASMF
ncbi:DUF2799 domain-containing protein [Psychromonas hadalis]|uniref:DUF2799 domain-containing protein n=1 Tax=Psychromonas hadalis TaxID=211669 RepID=UPI0003B47E92|nr:DUF2799 domain-containing protein [Psychromonas hadalis]